VADRFVIPFSRPSITGRELHYLRQAVELGQLSGDGEFTRRCQSWLSHHFAPSTPLLTHSCTGALEIAALLCDLAAGDEVIMPAYTFASTATCVVARGARPVFVDIRSDTLNVDEGQIEAAITPRTKAIFVMHYGGIACNMRPIIDLAARHGVIIVEDAAHALLASYQDRPLGTLGALGAVSFHATKNVVSGEGGVILVNDRKLIARAEILRDKGTNRSAFSRGEVPAYEWVDHGSSYAPSELVAAFLLAQLEAAHHLTVRRRRIWLTYHEALGPYEVSGQLRRPTLPVDTEHNAHIYYVLLRDRRDRDAFIRHMAEAGIDCRTHYRPLHQSLAGQHFGRAAGPLPVTENTAERLLRLPLWADMKEEPQSVLAAARGYFEMTSRHP
jgi:dTDP-4-amino-4,6-dideoxygalactose transaminase